MVVACLGWLAGIPLGWAMAHGLISLTSSTAKTDLAFVLPASHVLVTLLGTVLLAQRVLLAPLRRAVPPTTRRRAALRLSLHRKGLHELATTDLADLLAERHRIISNDWQSASMAQMIARTIDRALAVLARVDLTPAALRAGLAGDREAARYAFSASELLDHAADLAAQSAILTHDNERRWRVFHQRVTEMTSSHAPRAATVVEP